MMTRGMMGVGWWVVAASVALAQGGARLGAAERGRSYRAPYSRGGYQSRGQTLRELTIEQQRQLGLSGEQIKKIAEQRRDLERERAKIEEQLEKARDASRAVYAEVSRIQTQLRELDTEKLEAVFRSVMTKDQLKAWEQKRYLDMARQFLRGYRQWLKLTDEQVDDLALLLVPVYQKYEQIEDEKRAAREQVAELRRADEIDVVAIEKAEKELDGLQKTNVYTARRNELMKAMRSGLLPEQAKKLDQRWRRR